MAVSDIITRLRMQGQTAYASAATSSAKSLDKIDDASKRASTGIKHTGEQADKAKGPLAGLGKSMRGFIAGSAAMFGAGQVIKDSVGNAVDLADQTQKTAAVFKGEALKSITAWSKGTADALGMSQRESLGAAGTFGNMLDSMGVAESKTGDMSKRLVTLAADMAEFNAKDPSETLKALQMGLTGSGKGLKTLGVTLNSARIKQEALNSGLIKAGDPLSDSAKAAASYAIIMKDTAKQQGTVAQSGHDLGFQQQQLKARYDDFTATIGTKLIPLLDTLAHHLGDIATIVAGMVIAWGGWTLAAAAAATGTTGLTGAVGLLTAAMAANPVGAVIVGLTALGTALVLAYRKVAWFRKGVDAAFGFIKAGAEAVFGWIKGHWQLLVSILGGPFIAVGILIVKHWDKILGFIKGLPGKIARAAVGMWDGIVDAFKGAINVILSAWNSIEFRIPEIDPPGPGPKFGGFTVGLPDIPLLASGGTIGRAGMAIVGERGPELVELPTSARVSPLTSSASLSSIGSGGGWRVEVPVYLNARQIALAVADDTSDRIARR